MKTKTIQDKAIQAKTDRVRSTARALAGYDKEYLLTLANLYHIEIWDEKIAKEALVAIIAQAAWN
jgi:parvulin-like peptidyl-prolyl isomerase